MLSIDEGAIKDYLGELVRTTVGETPNAALDIEADKMMGASYYERDETSRNGYRAGHYSRNITTRVGDAEVMIPRLKGLRFAAAIIALLDDKERGVEVALISRRFHDAFVSAILELSYIIRVLYEINTLALCGGVFMNRYLIEQSIETLTNEGFVVAVNQDLPPNDASLSFGEAVVACAQTLE